MTTPANLFLGDDEIESVVGDEQRRRSISRPVSVRSGASGDTNVTDAAELKEAITDLTKTNAWKTMPEGSLSSYESVMLNNITAIAHRMHQQFRVTLSLLSKDK